VFDDAKIKENPGCYLRTECGVKIQNILENTVGENEYSIFNLKLNCVHVQIENLILV
jgi:hypothetical protein